MSGITSFTAIAADSAINFAWEVSAALISVANIAKITITLNDFEVAGSMQQYNITPVLFTDPVSGVVTGITSTAKISTFAGLPLVNGVEYGAAIAINTTTGIYVTHITDPIKPLNVPNKPQLTVKAVESKILVSITNLTTEGEIGFSPLTSILVYLSSHETSPKIFKLIQLVPADFGADLKSTYPFENGVNGLSIQNGKKYEVAMVVSNILGNSPISDTFTVTPSDLPGTIDDKIALPTIVYDESNVSSATILFGNADDQASLLTSGYPILNYKVYRYSVDPSNSRIASTKTLIQTVVTDPLSGLSATPDVSFNYNQVNYPFKVIDSTVVLGTRYQYAIAGSNFNGEGIENYCTIMRAGKLADAPTISLTPSNNDILASAIRPVNMGGFLPYTTAPDASGAFSYYFRYTWLTPDASNVLQQVAQVISASSNVSSGISLTNGTVYTVKAEAITRYENVDYYGLAADALSIPYGPAPAPAAVTFSTVDANGPLNGAIDASWNAVTDKNGSNGAITYSVLVQDSSSIMQVFASGITDTTYKLTGLTNGTSYVITVRADVYNAEIDGSVPGTQTAQQTVVPFRLPTDASNVRVSRPTSSSFNILFDICGNVTGKADANIRSKVIVQELSGGIVTGVSSEYIINGTGAKTQAYSGSEGKSYQIDVTTGVVDDTVTYYNSGSVSINRTMYALPDGPQNLQVQALNGGFRVTWDAPTHLNGTELTGYRIATGYSPSFTTITTIVKDVEYYIAQGFENGVAVPVSVFSQATAPYAMSVIESSPAGPIIVTPGSAPAAPQNLIASGADSTVTLTWSRDNNVAGYQVTQNDNPSYSRTYALGDGSGWTFGISTIQFIAPGLTNGETYTFKISSFKVINGASIYSADTSVTAVPFAAPSPPQNLICSVGSQSITSSWSAPSSTAGANLGDNGPILYNLIIDASYTDASSIPVTSTVLNQSGITAAQIPYTFSSSSLLNGKHYTVKVSAYFVNSSNNNSYVSNFAGPASVVVNPPPQDVSGLTVVPGNFQNVISWTNPTDALTYTRTQVKIFQKLGAGSESLLATLTPVASVMPTTYTATGLQNGGLYTYRVVSEHSASAQQPAGISRTGMPFGKAVLISATPNVSGSSTYSLLINKNGSNLLDYVAIGALNDACGNVAIPVIQGTVPGTAIYSGAAGTFSSGGAFAAGQEYTLVLNMGVNVTSVLAIIENSAGFITRTIPTGVVTATFGQLQ